MGDKSRSEELQEHHNQGQSDGANGRYDPPPAVGILNIFDPSSHTEEMNEDRDVYDTGYENGRTGGD